MIDDDCEGLWRIHDDLYDLTNWEKNHPGLSRCFHFLIILGGRDWLVLTKGTDCTEAFETFHVFGVSSTVLQKFWVKKANTPRRYRYVIQNMFDKTYLLTTILGSHSIRMDSSKHCKAKLQRF